MTRTGAALALALVAIATSPTARAQSKRYPAVAVDPDDRTEHESAFWSRVVDPDRGRYDQAVRDALLTARGDRERAVELLRAAATSRPELVDAWGYLGLLADQIRDFAGCADAYRHAAAIDPRWKPDPMGAPSSGMGVALDRRRPLTIALAICRDRSGDVAGAIAGLEAVIDRGESLPELWLRLGEAYLAAGRLADAADALGVALAGNSRDPEAAWLLAVAYDRARRTSLAEAAAADAQGKDPNAVNATSAGRPPPIAPGDREYLLGLAALTPPAGEPPQPISPERALVLFRGYLAVAPASPWRARAREHLDAVAAVDLASRLDVTGGGFGDEAAALRAIRAGMPALRACAKPLPATLFELTITAFGPAAGPGAPPPARLPTPPPRPGGATVRLRALERPPATEEAGVSAATTLRFDPDSDALDGAIACLEQVGAAIALPRPPAGSWAKVVIPIAAP